ncbi:MAG TPA: GNAT family N-acetyltransferase [Candidatus Bathyarchaeia archaeon]|nr:GNAT family N-acetyltransferase [Candidatus Bathyarchaeia archaeon]
MTETTGSICRAFTKKDERPVKALVETSFRDFLSGKYWAWKYKFNPNFDPALVGVAEKDGRVVGCNHWLLRNLKISNQAEVQAILGADIAVEPKFRGQGIAKSLLLYMRSLPVMSNRQAMISYMFADPNLSRNLYEPVAGYIPAPSATVSYVKILKWKELEKRIGIMNHEIRNDAEKFDRLPKSELTILFRLLNTPQLLLSLSKKGIEIYEAGSKKAKVTVTSDFTTLARIKKSEHRMYHLLAALVTRNLKIRGSLVSLFRFYRNLWLIEDVFSQRLF